MENEPNNRAPSDAGGDGVPRNLRGDNDNEDDNNGSGDDDDDEENHDEVEVVAAAPAWRVDATALLPARTCNLDPLSDLQIIPVKTCRSSNYLIDPKACERTGVVAVMVSLTTAANNKAATLVNQGGSRYVPGSDVKRLRMTNVLTPVKYDRIVTLADCSSPKGDVFACLLRTKTESEKFFSSMRVGQDGIGDVLLLEEVYPVDDTLGNTTNVALVKRCSHVLPLRGDMRRLVPDVPIKAAEKGDTRYFCQHQVRTIQFGHASIQQAICGGKLWYECSEE